MKYKEFTMRLIIGVIITMIFSWSSVSRDARANLEKVVIPKQGAIGIISQLPDGSVLIKPNKKDMAIDSLSITPRMRLIPLEDIIDNLPIRRNATQVNPKDPLGLFEDDN